MPCHVTPNDVIDLKLHTYDACLTINMFVSFVVITNNFTTHIIKKSRALFFIVTSSVFFLPPLPDTNIVESKFIAVANFELQGTSGFDLKKRSCEVTHTK